MQLFLISYVLCIILSSIQATSADDRCSNPLEVWSECGAYCQSTCDYPKGLRPCPDICSFGCVCRDGLVRNAKGECVESTQCTATSMVCPGPNEEISRCNANGCQNTCDDPRRTSYCDAFSCSFGCICEKGYLRNSHGICTWAEDCGKCRDSNAEYSNFNATNCVNTCERPDLSTYCKPEQPGSGCICKKDYLKNKNGACLPAESCAICDDPNAHYSLTEATGCQDDCQNPTFSQVCRPAGPAAGCVCNTNYVKNERDLCVQVKQCGEIKCGLNEQYEECPNPCPPEDCATIGIAFKCAQPEKCTPGCKCIFNHRRDARGICVPIEQCRAAGCGVDPHAVYVLSADQFPKTCATRHLSRPNHPKINRKAATSRKPGCQCVEGYIQDEKAYNKCVKPNDCYKCNGQYEVLSRYADCSCKNSANCTSRILTVEEGCRCIDGYVRDENGKCISAEFCERCGENEEFQECGSPCPITCSDRFDKNVFCPLLCVKGCFCKLGMVRDYSGKCIMPEECEEISVFPRIEENTEIGCGGDINAVHDACGNTCPRTCENLGKNEVCPQYCIAGGGCVCKQGYVQRGALINGCIPEEQCPPSCGGDPNAINGTYNPTCRTTCDNHKVGNLLCAPSEETVGCNCKDGFVLDQLSNLCVAPDKCPDGCDGDINAKFVSCGETCPNTCNNLGRIIPCQKKCLLSGGCACKYGYVRGGPFNRCILPEQCPHCRENEVYSCGSACQDECSTLGEYCQIVNVRCNDDCFCVEGFARNSYGRCVPKDQCPRKLECHGDVNAHNVTSCPGICSVTCENYNKSTEPYKCDRYCPPEGECLCNDNKILDERTGQCVNPNECYKCSGENEAYTNAFDVTCDEIDSPHIKNILKEKKTERGCHCIINHVRNKQGVCIPAYKCPYCGNDEVYNECGSACPKTCNNLNEKNICTDQCLPGCFCKKDMVRNSRGQCIPTHQCDNPAFF